MKIVDIIVNNIWIKVLSLALAIATWFYVFDLVNIEPKIKESVENVLSREDIIVKDVPVRLDFRGKSPAGYRVDHENVEITPASISIAGPENIINSIKDIRTDQVDISEFTRPVRMKLGLHSRFRSLKMGSGNVDIYLPVEKIIADEINKVIPSDK
jgi:YbbR domain-containing protein